VLVLGVVITREIKAESRLNIQAGAYYKKPRGFVSAPGELRDLAWVVIDGD
jgi:hypothetical protein